MHILTDELFIFKGPNTQKATGAWKRCFVNDLLMTSRLRPAETARCSKQTPGESDLALWRHLPTER